MAKASKPKATKKAGGGGAGKAKSAAAAARGVRAAKPKVARAGHGQIEAEQSGADGKWNLRLYVAGQTPKSLTAFANLKRICEQNLPGRYNIEVVDLLKEPQLAAGDQIVAIPTLVRKLPEPIKRVIGDLSNLERVMVGMDLREVGK